MIDLKTSRREMYLKCTFWSQDENEDYVENSEIVHERIPSGYFFAKEINSYQVNSQVIGESFLTDQESISILTYDKIDDLKINDIVRINGRDKIYRVDDLQVTPSKKQRFFNTTDFSKTYYITLRG